MFAFLPFFFAFFFYAWWRFRYVFPRRYRYPGALLFTFFFTAIFFSRNMSNDFAFIALAIIGSFSIVFLANWVIFCIFWDIYLGVRRLLGKRKRSNTSLRMRKQHLFAGAVAALTLAFFLIGGPLNSDYKMTTVKETLSIKPKKPLRIALFSDIHFDALFPKSKLERIVDSLRILRPDAIFFAGDLADIPMSKLQERGYDSLFSQIRAPLGFYVSTGNHESFMNPDGRTIEWLRGFKNVTLLLDNTVCNDFFCVTGRLDHQYARRHSSGRIPLKELTPTNKSVPWFLIDHQPKGLDPEDVNLTRKPDYAFSGHTHAGQFFPVTVIIKFIWPLSYGRGELDGIPWFVTSGIGQWGPPVRVGSKAELVLFSFD
jgi:predicted MPP superfamily phosphohydrolase